MDLSFCRYWQGSGYPPQNKYCRNCPHSYRACDIVWDEVVQLANSNGGLPVRLPGTHASLLPNNNNNNIVHLKVNSKWNLSKEDFLHFISTGHAKMGNRNQRHDPTKSPSLTRQEPYVQSIVRLLGGYTNPLIVAAIGIM